MHRMPSAPAAALQGHAPHAATLLEQTQRPANGKVSGPRRAADLLGLKTATFASRIKSLGNRSSNPVTQAIPTVVGERF
jgi:hypothetical protein